MNEQPLPNVEYFYGEQLRWNFGFENPNKGAVIWACLLPLLFALWFASWRVRNLGLRIVALILSGAGFLACAYFLFMTFSRGGLVAAALGMLYVIIREIALCKKRALFPKKGILLATIALFIAGAGLFYYAGIAARALDTVTEQDDSVGNRFIIWKSGLQMAAENPKGIGAGNSGSTFMAWYQPVERTEKYRTLVNSYLTLLTERGYLIFFTALAIALFLWLWADPRPESHAAREIVFGLRALLLAFAASGFFSTVMEEPRLWIIPAIAAAILCIASLFLRRRAVTTSLALGPAIAAILCFALWLAGSTISGHDPLKREFAQKDGKAEVIAVRSKADGIYTVDLIPDPKVTGEEPGKLIRQLALDAKCEVRLSSNATMQDILAVAGGGIGDRDFSTARSVLLIAPERTDEATARRILTQSHNITVLLPEIDEDGRTDFWTGIIKENAKDTIHQQTLPGVGNDAAWAWPAVITATLQAHTAKN